MIDFQASTSSQRFYESEFIFKLRILKAGFLRRRLQGWREIYAKCKPALNVSSSAKCL